MTPGQYKKVETQIARGVQNGVGRVFSAIGGFFTKLRHEGSRTFTIMLVPHSQNKIFNLRVSVFALVFFGVSLLVGAGILVFTSINWTDLNRSLTQSTQELGEAQANIQAVQTEVGELRKVTRLFEESLSTTLGVIGARPPGNTSGTGGEGDLSGLQGMEQLESGTLWEVGELRNMRAYLAESITPLGEIGNVLQSQKKLLLDIPTLWPLQGGIGWVTFPFGPAIHPFTGKWYTHTGIDIAHRMGTPIVATANGVVKKVEYDVMGYGVHIEIEHSYGFSTLYAHLQRAYVAKGDIVKRGTVIAALGSTGQSTGPHLHYEVRIAKQVVDPSSYLNISAGFLERR